MPLYRGSGSGRIPSGEVIATQSDIAEAITVVNQYKNSAGISEQGAETAFQNAVDTLHDFRTRYLGASVMDLTTDLQGNALIDGALYYNTTDTSMKVYDADTSAWIQLKLTDAQQAAVDTVAAIESDVSTVSGISADVSTVAAVDTNVTNVSSISTDVTTVSGISGDVTTVAGSDTSVNTVATNIADVNTVSSVSPDVVTVAGVSTDVTTVAGVSLDLTTVAGIETDVTTVANAQADVVNVSSISTDVTNVSSISTDVTTAADNITAIQNAPAEAQAAADSADAAAVSESNASTSESNAATSESNALTSENNAASSENLANQWAEEAEDVEVTTGAYSSKHHAIKSSDSASAAATSESNAATSESNALASENAAFNSKNAAQTAEVNAEDTLNAFQNQYQGDFANDPTQRPDGTALQPGDIHFNTTSDRLRVYDGTEWKGTTSDEQSIRDLFSASGDLNYDNLTGVFTVTVPQGYDSTDFNTDFSNKSTSDLTEGANLYYTDARVDTHLTGGTGVGYSAGTISIGQPVGVSDNVEFNKVNVSTSVVFGDGSTQSSAVVIGSGADEVSTNSILGQAAFRDVGTGAFELPNNSNIESTIWDFDNMPKVSGNAIVERGSNSLGTWVRYADGTQMIWRDFTTSSSGQTNMFIAKSFSSSNYYVNGESATSGTLTVLGTKIQNRSVGGMDVGLSSGSNWIATDVVVFAFGEWSA